MGLSADAPLSWFLHRHLPTFAPRATRAVYLDTAIVTILS
jgi:diadenosine tetraphosphatase ApaH/serine/threonine PP2A family protein phosphatase